MLVPPLRPPVGWAWDPGVGLSSAEAARRLGDTARTGLPRRARTAMAGLPPPVPEPVDPDPAGCGRGQPGGDPLVTTATVRRDSRTVRVDAAELVPGDVVMVEARDRIPADGRRFLGPRWSCRNPRTPAKRSRSASPPPRAGQRAAYSLTEPAIQLVPVFAQLGSWGLRHRPTSRALRVRAELLEQGGPALWQEFMDELRRSHLGSEFADRGRAAAHRPSAQSCHTRQRPAVSRSRTFHCRWPGPAFPLMRAGPRYRSSKVGTSNSQDLWIRIFWRPPAGHPRRAVRRVCR